MHACTCVQLTRMHAVHSQCSREDLWMFDERTVLVLNIFSSFVHSAFTASEENFGESHTQARVGRTVQLTPPVQLPHVCSIHWTRHTNGEQ